MEIISVIYKNVNNYYNMYLGSQNRVLTHSNNSRKYLKIIY